MNLWEVSVEIAINDNAARPLVMALLGITANCRQCGAELSAASAVSFTQGKRVKCICGWYGVWKDNTALAGARLSNIQFLALFFKYTLPNDAPAIAEQLGLSAATVRAWRERIITGVAA